MTGIELVVTRALCFLDIFRRIIYLDVNSYSFEIMTIELLC